MYNVDSTAYNVDSTAYDIEITTYGIESTKVKKHRMLKAPIKMVFDQLRQLWLSISLFSVADARRSLRILLRIRSQFFLW